jgi:hypothetical protein
MLEKAQELPTASAIVAAPILAPAGPAAAEVPGAAAPARAPAPPPAAALQGGDHTAEAVTAPRAPPAAPAEELSLDPHTVPYDPSTLRPPSRARNRRVVMAALVLLGTAGVLFIAASLSQRGAADDPAGGARPIMDVRGVARPRDLAAQQIKDGGSADRTVAGRTTDGAGRPAPADASADEQGRQASIDTRGPAPRRGVSRPTRLGRLSVNSIPWAYVYIDGAYRGETPLQELKLSAGHHTLRLENPERKLTRSLRIKIRPDQTLSKSLLLR